ncbi:MAG: type IV pilus secretin PilQ [Bdellovibrionaceae bacterium]|nr:type IV pilus secretin PilQ [Pseudobdellovibrionaceae bacterium]
MKNKTRGIFRLLIKARKFYVVAIFLVSLGCATGPEDSSDQAPPDDLSAEVASGDPNVGATLEDSQNSEAKPAEDEFLDDLNKTSGEKEAQQSQESLPPQEPPPPIADTSQPPTDPNEGALSLEDNSQQQHVEQAPPPVENIAAPSIEAVQPPPEMTPAPAGRQKAVEIVNLNYKANESGGTVVIEGTAPLTYTTRSNPELKQFIVEVSNSKLPARLKRSLNTKDFNGAIGAIDAYQASGSKVSRFVIQLREGSSEPFVQVEGNSLLIVSSDSTAPGMAPTAASINQGQDSGQDSGQSSGDQVVAAEPLADGDLNINLNDSRILTSQALSEFLAGSTKFYGKRISVEFNRTDLRQAIRFFMEETGVNMIIDKDVDGQTTMKLRQVPWDQAFITMLRMSDLSYQRQGNILRIATIKKLQAEEKEARDLMDAQKQTQPLLVRNFFVNFATVSNVSKSIKELLKEGGKESPTTKIVEDPNNGKLIIQDTEHNLNLIDKLVKNLDMPIKQVLIEAKVVEASEKFSRSMGISWNFMRGSQVIGGQTLQPKLLVGQSVPGADLSLGMKYGSLPFLGDLDATLGLAESEDNVKVISSPRIMTLTGLAASMNVTQILTTANVQPPAAAGGAPTVTYKETNMPTVLNVTPVVTPDNYVTMKVSVTRTVGSVNASGSITTNSRAVDTNILIRDGQTATIGGLYQTDTTEGVNGVPGLKDIPFLGALFRSKAEIKSKTELLIFLTPRIISPDVPNTQAKEGVSL